jgi:hypothetical protein
MTSLYKRTTSRKKRTSPFAERTAAAEAATPKSLAGLGREQGNKIGGIGLAAVDKTENHIGNTVPSL